MKLKLVFLVSLLCAVVAPLSADLPGGVRKIDDLESEEVQAAARAVVTRLNQISNSVYKTVLVRVTAGTVQIVAGKKYVLTLEVGRSTACRKDDDITDTCPISMPSIETWTATVLYHPWMSPEYEILSLEKKDDHEPQERQLSHISGKVGAPVPLEDVHDKYVVGAAEAAVAELNKRSNSLFKTVLVEVLHGAAQVVNGVKYTLTVQVSMSQCKNDGKMSTLEQCPMQAGTEETWQAVVWQHPTVPPQYDILALDRVP